MEKSAERAQVTRDFVIDEVVKILRNTVNPVVKLQCTEQLRKLVLWRDSDGSSERTPEIHIHSDGGLTIL